MWNQPLVQRRVDSVHGNLTQIRANFVDVNCHLPQGVRAVHRYLGDAAAPTERHHLGNGADDRGLRRNAIEQHVTRIVLRQRLVEPVQNVLMRRAREGNGHSLLTRCGPKAASAGRDAAVGVEAAGPCLPAVTSAGRRSRPPLSRSRPEPFRQQARRWRRPRGGRRLQLGVERSRKVLVVRLRQPARSALLRRCENRRGCCRSCRDSAALCQVHGGQSRCESRSAGARERR